MKSIMVALQEKGLVQVRFRSDFHQKFTLIDQNIVWYGSINFLSFSKADESIMRFESAEIAGQLMDTMTEG